MTINLHLPAKNEILRPTITVIGVGGAGGNAVNNMIAASLEGVNFVVANTDAQALDHSLTERTIQLGAGLTKGLGAGANPEIGRGAAEEAREEIAAYIEGSNMVFITAGMGGGTGTGAASVVARIAKEQGVLTVGVVTKPFTFEGTHRMKMAEAGLKELQEYVDTLIIIPNQNLFRIANERTTFADAFKMADEVLHSGVRGVTDLMVKPGLINLDFADIRAVMREMGKAMMGTGEASGDRRAVEAAEAAISNPLLDDVSLKGAKALLINITGGPDMTLFEVDEAANRVREEVDPEANIIFGSTFNDEMQGKMRVSVVATGIDAPAQVATAPQKYAMAGEPKKPYSFSSAATAKSEPIKAITPPPRVSVFDAPRERERAYAPQEQTAQVQLRPVAERQAPQQQQPIREQREPQREQAVQPQEMHEMPAPRVRQQEYQQYQEEAEEHFEEDRMPAAPRESAAPAFEARSMPPVVSPRRSQQYIEREREDASQGKGFFQRVADVSRVFSGKPEVSDRIQVTQRSAQVEVSEKKAQAAAAEEEQYLDIPAFLRRQAN